MFENTKKQNTIIIITIIAITLGIDSLVQWEPFLYLTYMINPSGGLANIIDSLYIIIFFILPFKKPRAFIWNTFYNLKQRIQEKRKIRELSKKENIIFTDTEQGFEDLNEYKKNVKFENQHYTIRIEK